MCENLRRVAWLSRITGRMHFTDTENTCMLSGMYRALSHAIAFVEAPDKVGPEPL